MAAKLPRLQIGNPIGYVKGDKVYIDPVFQRFIQTLLETLESRLGAVELAELNDAITAANDAADSAQAAADTANTAATDAQTATDANARWLKIRNSNVTGLTINAADAGTDVTVTFSAHQRNYTDGSSVAVAGGSITGLPYSTDEYFFYDQASLLGGAVTYQATTNAPDSLTTDATGAFPDRHFLGSMTTPAAGPGTTPGGIVIPPVDTSVHGVWA